MRTLTLRGLLARRTRSALTALAVVLGVALMVGTLVLTDTLDRSINQTFVQAGSGYDAVVTAKQFAGASGAEAAPVPAATLDRIRRVPGAAGAVGVIGGGGQIVDERGRTLGADPLIASTVPRPYSPFRTVEGREPRAPGEVAIDRHTAREHRLSVGSRIGVAGIGAAEPMRVVGITRFGDADSPGSPVASLPLAVAQRLTGKPGGFDEIEVRAAEGTSATALRRQLRAALPATAVVRTSAESAKEQSKDAQDSVAILTKALLVFAAISLLVGGFIIFNTFAITVAQRAREFALLRMLGASRRQILRSVVLEALLIGLVASAAGLGIGIGVAVGLRELFGLVGADLPTGKAVIAGHTVQIALIVGTGLTVLAALMPARRATRIPPIAALRDASDPAADGPRHRRPRRALLVLVAGLLLLAWGLFGHGGSGPLVLGSLLTAVAVGLLGSRAVIPLASVVGVPLQLLRGTSGRLARENAVRNPRRTASTASALMIGVTLVSLVAIFAAGLAASNADKVRRAVVAPLVLRAGEAGGSFSLRAADALARTPGVADVSTLGEAPAKVGRAAAKPAVGVDPTTVDRAIRLQWQHGSASTLRRLGPGDVVVGATFAKQQHVRVGQTITMTSGAGHRLRLVVRGIYKDKVAQLAGPYIVSNETLIGGLGGTKARWAFVLTTPGSDPATVARAAKARLAQGYGDVVVRTKAQFVEDRSQALAPILTMVYVLLSLSVLIALFGIANTLTLSIHERTRELGLLRAIGMTRRQVRAMVRYEAVITAVIGALLGVGLGTLLGAVTAKALEGEGMVFRFPLPAIVLIVVVAAIAGVLAAVAPARRAARLEVLEALAHD